MKKIKILTLAGLMLLGFNSCKKKIYGCMDESAENYSPVATQDGKDCVYPKKEELISKVFKNTTFSDNGTSYTATIYWDKITQSVVDKGGIDAYFSIDNGVNWVLLPFTYPSGYSNTSTTINVLYSQGEVTLGAQDSDNLILDNPGPMDVKIVILK